MQSIDEGGGGGGGYILQWMDSVKVNSSEPCPPPLSSGVPLYDEIVVGSRQQVSPRPGNNVIVLPLYSSIPSYPPGVDTQSSTAF